MSKKLDSRSFALQRRRRRQWLTFVRMVRYGINNFSRNLWLTIAATAVMTVTLLIILMTLAARNVLIDTVNDIQSKVDMSIYVRTDIDEVSVQTISQELGQLSSVTKVTYISPSQAREEFAQQQKTDPEALSALNEATNRFPGIFRVGLVDINDTSQLSEFVKTNQTYLMFQDAAREPSFEGERRTAIQEIARTVNFAEKAGLVASFVFVIISSLIVFNTIRMAIFNRKEEIQMMKLIGADKSFIRGPFVVEAIVYGFIAAVIATALGYMALISSKDTLMNYGIAVQSTIDMVTLYIGFVILGVTALGAVIGAVSALLATRKYLK